MPYSDEKFTYGPVAVLGGQHKGRIGNLDDDTIHKTKAHGIVYFAPSGISPFYTYIPLHYLDKPNTQQLLKRYAHLYALISPYYKGNETETDARIASLEELVLISEILSERMFSAQFTKPHLGAKIFLSHSSHDKDFVKGLAVDLSNLGHSPWLDEWEILGGESIPSKIANGIDDADFVVLVLSKYAVKSTWVEQEWQAKYWTDITNRNISIIPILIDECDIPTLLRTKKYIDFRLDYTAGLEQLTHSVSQLQQRKTK